jgi:PTH1 family peptidyl-tRNA hydrolase
MFFLIVGLGNPGKAYRTSRHNIGFQVVDHLAERHAIAWGRKKFSGECGSGEISGKRVMLLKPQTYMNLSGESVGAASRYLKIGPDKIVVVHDDVDLALGRIQVRMGGGHGGHRGVESVLEDLRGADFYRVRIGVGRPAGAEEVSDFVLEEFSESEQEQVQDTVNRATRAIETLINDGLTAAMNRYNPWSGNADEGQGSECKETDT